MSEDGYAQAASVKGKKITPPAATTTATTSTTISTAGSITVTTPVSNYKVPSTSKPATVSTSTMATVTTQLPASSNGAAEVKVLLFSLMCVILSSVFLLASLHQCQHLHQPHPLNQHKKSSQPLQQRLVNKNHQSQQQQRYPVFVVVTVITNDHVL